MESSYAGRMCDLSIRRFHQERASPGAKGVTEESSRHREEGLYRRRRQGSCTFFPSVGPRRGHLQTPELKPCSPVGRVVGIPFTSHSFSMILGSSLVPCDFPLESRVRFSLLESQLFSLLCVCGLVTKSFFVFISSQETGQRIPAHFIWDSRVSLNLNFTQLVCSTGLLTRRQRIEREPVHLPWWGQADKEN